MVADVTADVVNNVTDAALFVIISFSSLRCKAHV
jgi:hypothetical protein